MRRRLETSPPLNGASPYPSIAGARVLVVEERYLLALDLVRMLEDCGAAVVGPYSDVVSALRPTLDQRLDCAVLDTDVRGASATQLAEALSGQRVPFFFATGYGMAALPNHLADRPLVRKPYTRDQILSTVEALLAPVRLH
ncbi:MAG: response regulator [Pseudomonadota bacterium]